MRSEKKYYITDEQMSSIEWFHLQEDTEKLRAVLRVVEKTPVKMRSEEEIRKRKSVLRETLANTYGKDMPYEEERLQSRIEEDDWVLNDKGEK